MIVISRSLTKVETVLKHRPLRGYGLPRLTKQTREISSMNITDKETELKIACAKLQILIALGKAHSTQEDIKKEWVIMSLTSAQKRKASTK